MSDRLDHPRERHAAVQRCGPDARRSTEARGGGAARRCSGAHLIGSLLLAGVLALVEHSAHAALRTPAQPPVAPAGAIRRPAAPVDVAPHVRPIDADELRLRLLRDGAPPLSLAPSWSSVLPDAGRLAKVAVSPEIRDAARRLDHADWAIRDEAARVLRESENSDEELMALLEREPLGAEQRHRLLAILCERLASAPRGAIGIRMRPGGDLMPGVLIEGLLPGMPAESVLRVGDRIVAIDDRPVTNGDGLTTIIQVERPGRVVRLDVLRPKRDEQGRELRDEALQPIVERVIVDLELGSSDELDRFDEGMGVRRMPSRIASIRAEQVREAMRRFAPTTIDIGIVVRPTSMMTEVDDHPAIRSLLLYRQWIDEGSIRVTDSLRRGWQQTLEQVRLAAADPTLSPDRRRELEAIAERYAELIP